MTRNVHTFRLHHGLFSTQRAHGKGRSAEEMKGQRYLCRTWGIIIRGSCTWYTVKVFDTCHPVRLRSWILNPADWCRSCFRWRCASAALVLKQLVWCDSRNWGLHCILSQFVCLCIVFGHSVQQFSTISWHYITSPPLTIIRQSDTDEGQTVPSAVWRMKKCWKYALLHEWSLCSALGTSVSFSFFDKSTLCLKSKGLVAFHEWSKQKAITSFKNQETRVYSSCKGCGKNTIRNK